MTTPAIAVHHIGAEGQPLVIIDDFAPDPDALCAAAIGTQFGAAAHHYFETVAIWLEAGGLRRPRNAR